MMEIWEKT